MPKSQIDSVALLAAVLAGAVALMRIPGPFVWFASIVGLILLLILLAYDREGYRSIFQTIAFSAVCGFAAMLAGAGILRLLADRGEIHLANDQWVTTWMPLTWLFATAMFCGIDRARMSGTGRRPQEARRPLPVHGGFITDYAAPGPVPSDTLSPEPVPAATVYGAPAFSDAVSHENVTLESTVQQPFLTRSASAQALPEETAAPAPAPVISHPGKETTIYVTLVGEGLNVLRSVQAEHLGRDFYRIIDSMPEGETWQYQPGQVVRCKKRNLSSGKALVAIEEAPRAS
jgi:hypothetical protein